MKVELGVGEIVGIGEIVVGGLVADGGESFDVACAARNDVERRAWVFVSCAVIDVSVRGAEELRIMDKATDGDVDAVLEEDRLESVLAWKAGVAGLTSRVLAAAAAEQGERIRDGVQ